MNVVFKVNLGMVDAKRLGLDDTETFPQCKAGYTVNVDKGVAETLIKEGHAVAADKAESDPIAASAMGIPDGPPEQGAVVRGLGPKAAQTGVTAAASRKSADEGEEETSEVANLTVPEAVDKISRMRSKEHLESIRDTDTRQGVKAAAEKRLAEIGP